MGATLPCRKGPNGEIAGVRRGRGGHRIIPEGNSERRKKEKPVLEQAPPGHIHTRKAGSYARGQERSGLKGRGCASHVPNAEERHQCTPQSRTKGLDPQQCLSQIGYG